MRYLAHNGHCCTYANRYEYREISKDRWKANVMCFDRRTVKGKLCVRNVRVSF